MKKIALILTALVALFALTACTTTEKAAGVGAAAGAVIGGATTGTLGGAAAGAVIGGVSGAIAGELLGRYRDDPSKCVYEDRYGRRFVDDCPEG